VRATRFAILLGIFFVIAAAYYFSPPTTPAIWCDPEPSTRTR